MTAQISEKLRYQGMDMQMLSPPLGTRFSKAFTINCTALRRGYVGQWEILDDRLYLIGLDAVLHDGTEASIASFFPDSSDRVFADWYSGTLRIPQGKMLEYVHSEFDSSFEQDMLLDVECGVVKNIRIRHNGTASEDAQEGYSVSMALFY